MLNATAVPDIETERLVVWRSKFHHMTYDMYEKMVKWFSSNFVTLGKVSGDKMYSFHTEIEQTDPVK